MPLPTLSIAWVGSRGKNTFLLKVVVLHIHVYLIKGSEMRGKHTNKRLTLHTPLTSGVRLNGEILKFLN